MTSPPLLSVAVTGLLGFALAWPVWPALAIERDGEPAGVVRLDAEREFAITFLHSLDNLPVEDHYAVRGGQVVQTSTRLVEFGAGSAHLPGQGVGQADGRWWVISGMDHTIGEVNVRVGAASTEHELRYPDGVLHLADCWSGESVTLRATELSTLERILPASRPPLCSPTLSQGRVPETSTR